MLQSLPDFFITIAYIFIFGYLAVNTFEYFYRRVSPFDPGALIGIGVVGCIGFIGFILRNWDGIHCIALCYLGGCIGSGIYRFNENPKDHQIRYRAVGSGNGQKAVGW